MHASRLPSLVAVWFLGVQYRRHKAGAASHSVLVLLLFCGPVCRARQPIPSCRSGSYKILRFIVALAQYKTKTKYSMRVPALRSLVIDTAREGATMGPTTPLWQRPLLPGFDEMARVYRRRGQCPFCMEVNKKNTGF